MGQYSIPWGSDETITLPIPPHWRVVSDCVEKIQDPIQDITAKIYDSLDHPIGCPPLKDLIDSDTQIALVMDDNGRPTPIHLIVPVLLDYIEKAGAKLNNITGLFAVGTHNVMSEAEMTARAGRSVMDRIQCFNFDCHQSDEFVDLGFTQRGTPVLINRIAAEADIRILVGTVEPHPQAGFGGGFKNILPGLAAAETIAHNHLLLPSPFDYNMVGTLPDDNPMRLDLEEAGKMIPGRTFLLNVVLNSSLKPIAIICGDPIQAHRVGVNIARELYEIELPHLMDIVITSSHPMDQDLRQGGKAILNVVGACRPGGVILAFLKCQDGLKNVNLPGSFPPMGLTRMIAKILGCKGIYSLAQRLPESVPGEDRFLFNLALNIIKDFNVLIYSPQLMNDSQGKFPPIVFNEVDAVFNKANQLIKVTQPNVAIIHQGGVNYPKINAGDQSKFSGNSQTENKAN